MMTDYSQEEKVVVATAIFKMKVQQTMERIGEENLQKEDAYEEDEEIHMEDLEQAPPERGCI